MQRPEPGGSTRNHTEDGPAHLGEVDDADEDRVRTYQPALPTLTQNIRDTRERLLDGFADRRALLEWEQDLCVRTLGRVPHRFYKDIARSFRSGADDRTLLAVLIRGGIEGVDLPRDVARSERRRMAAHWIVPGFMRAFRHLRSDAQQYIAEAAEAEHDPDRQRHIAMRPSLNELADYQQRALGECLKGFDTVGEILEWGDHVALATHGEIPQDFITRCYSERASRRVLLDSVPGAARERELLCAHHLLPRFNRGARAVAGRAGELPESEREDTEYTVA